MKSISDAKLKNFINESPLICDAKNSYHILIFRRILELAISQYRWSGRMAEIS